MKEETTTIQELKNYASILGKTPGRRNIPYALYNKCCKEFGTLNEAKKLAELKIYKRTADVLTKKSMRRSKELVRIISYITGDGHLHKDLKGFLLSSKDFGGLESFRRDIKKQFDVNISKIETTNENRYGVSYQYRYFNTSITKFLYSMGAPRGDKVSTKFDVPLWIKENRFFMKEYLKILFYCEGTKYKNYNKTRIAIAMSKEKSLFNVGMKFMNSLKIGLNSFNIDSCPVRISQEYIRKKDSKLITYLRFEIDSQSIDRFIKRIGWLK